MAVHGIERPDGAVNNDFYRQVLHLDLRDKREFTTDILSAMGGIRKSRFAQLKALLQLSDEALELADRYHLDEFRLRHVLNLPPDDQPEMVRQIINFNLTGRQVQEMCQQGKSVSTQDEQPLPKEARQLVRLMRTLNASTSQAVARVLLQQEKDIQIARARLSTLKNLINEVEKCLIEE